MHAFPAPPRTGRAVPPPALTTGAAKVDVILVYPLPAMRAALRSLIDSEPDLAVTTEAGTADALEPDARLGPTAVLVLGHDLPGAPGTVEIELAAAHTAGAAVVLVGLEETPRADLAAGRAGTPTYVPLSRAGSELAEAVRRAALDRAPTNRPGSS